MMRKSLILFLLFSFLFSGFVSAQRDSSRNDFMNAESWLLYEEYGEAEALYQKLLKWDPENDNLKYRIGICLLEDPFRKKEAIAYLEEASKNINPDYKEGSFKETTAAPDVLYYLGKAYLVNEMLDKAIDTYREFLKIMDPEIYDEQLVRAQIKSCENAKRLKTMPVDIDLHPMGPEVNTRYSEVNPVISGNGERMAFITKQPFFDEALFIEKVNGEWTLPMSITSMLGFDMNIYPVALNYDGSEILLYYDEDLIGNLYTSRYEDGFWLPAEILGEQISTKYWESHASFSKDGQSLYFTSNRKGSLGGLDIYLSELGSEGKWGEPQNLGSTINTPYNEESPFISNDGTRLYFSSYGHYNMGGYDIFYSTKGDNGRWGKPVNMGYPINTTDDDLFFHPAENGNAGYQSRISPRGTNGYDIYYMDIYSVNNPRMYVVTGFVRTEDGDTDLTTLQMFVIDPETGDTLQYNIPIDPSGAFSLDLTKGSYALLFKGKGYEDLISPLSVSKISNKEGVKIEETLLLELLEKEILVFVGEESDIVLKDTAYTAPAGIPLLIPIKVEKGADLFVNVYQDSVLVHSDTIHADKRKIELELVPLVGLNLVELEMTDSDGNIHRNKVMVTGVEAEPLPVIVETIPDPIDPDADSSDTVEALAVDPSQAEIEEPLKTTPDKAEDPDNKSRGGKLALILGLGLAGIFILFLLIFIRRRRSEG